MKAWGRVCLNSLEALDLQHAPMFQCHGHPVLFILAMFTVASQNFLFALHRFLTNGFLQNIGTSYLSLLFIVRDAVMFLVCVVVLRSG